MKNKLFLILGIVFISLSISCSTKNSKILKTFPSHNERVFITEESLPAEIHFELITSIEVGKKWYGSSTSATVAMADRAREVGANAVIQVRTWHAPSGFSWAAPHGAGQAVRITDIKKLEEHKIKGTWY